MMHPAETHHLFNVNRPSVSGEQMVCFEKSFFKFICCPVSLLQEYHDIINQGSKRTESSHYIRIGSRAECIFRLRMII